MLTNSVALASALADIYTNTNISSFYLLTCCKYNSTTSGLNVCLSLSSINRAQMCGSVNNCCPNYRFPSTDYGLRASWTKLNPSSITLWLSTILAMSNLGISSTCQSPTLGTININSSTKRLQVVSNKPWTTMRIWPILNCTLRTTMISWSGPDHPTCLSAFVVYLIFNPYIF